MTRIRVIHSQTGQGPLLINDIEDGMPRKEFAYLHKQQVYVPRVDPVDPTVAGFADLVPTDKVLLSVDKGVIKGLVASGNALTPVYFTDADLATPVVATAVLAGTLTITGTGLTSLSPDQSSVVVTGTGATTVTQAQIIAGGGVVTAVSIVVPAALVVGVAVATSSAKVVADRNSSNVVAVS